MLHIDFICQHPQVVREALQKRRDPHTIDEILRLAEQRRGLVSRCDGLYTALKTLKEHNKSAGKRMTPDPQMKALTHDIRQLEMQVSEIAARLQPLLLSLPNLPHQNVPEGGDAE